MVGRVVVATGGVGATPALDVGTSHCTSMALVSTWTAVPPHLPPDRTGPQLVAFFDHWAWRHDYNGAVVCARTGGTVSKAAKDWTKRQVGGVGVGVGIVVCVAYGRGLRVCG